ncbi:hypothetical protein PV963_10905 [Streptomyces coeruleorubidus]|nr:hypothetical protein [Streptomyces coeruleorubidus]WDV50832.1 hypothetical protein PV963_10905 [Streptomyces coeruleorubidus]
MIGHDVRPFIGLCAHPFICKNHHEVTPGNSYVALFGRSGTADADQLWLF